MRENIKICITTTFDRNYKEAGKTLFNSIRRHTDCSGIDFKVITSDIEVLNELGKENCHFINEEIKARYSNVKYNASFPVERYSSSWYRYEIFGMTEYDRVICIDSDCICVEDISYLFSEELNEYNLISVEDYIVSGQFRSWWKTTPELEAQGLAKLAQRIEKGQIDIQPALLVANKNIVNEDWYKKLLNYANTTPFTYSIDEGILNDFIYLEDLKVKILPLEWDYQDLYELHCSWVPIPTKPIIIHCQESKPFKKQKSQLDPRMHKWWDMWWKEKELIKLNILDDLAIKHLSDKSSRFHNYAVKYDKILSSIKESFSSVLEIGVAKGQSIKMWTDYFQNAVIHGADIDPASVICESYSNRIKFHLIDQRNKTQLESLEQYAPFDLIIDDGDHLWMEQILTFKTLFPYVKKGGIYIVEDTTTSYWEEYNNNPISAVEYFKTLADEVHLNGEKSNIPDNPPHEFGLWEKGWHRREDCFKSLPLFDSIQFMNGVIVIYKR